jgi:beta-lactamase regulating signal transducer with metallopeptidase domain
MTEVFRTILNMSVTGSIVALCVALFWMPLRKVPRWIRCALWAVVFIRLFVPFSFSAPISLLGSIGAPAPVNGVVTYISADTVQGIPDWMNETTVPGTVLESELLPERMPNAKTAQTTTEDQQTNWIAIGTAVWLSGAAVMLLYAGIQYLLLKMRVADAVLTESGVYETDAVNTPFVFGILKPRIILPVDFPIESRALVLRHERAHIVRRDHITKPALFIVLSLHWFNPLAWLAFQFFCEDMEASCDEYAIQSLNREQIAAYGETLLRFGTRRVSFAGGPLAFGERCTKRRIMNVLNYKKPAFWVILVALLAALLTTAVLLANPVSLNVAEEPTDDELEYVVVRVSGDIKTEDIANPHYVPQKAAKEGLPDLNEFEPQTSATFLRFDLKDTLSLRLDSKALSNQDRVAKQFADILERLSNGQIYIQAYMKKNAVGYFNEENAEKFAHYLIVSDELYTYNVTCDAIDVQTGSDYTRCAQQYVFALMNAKELHWQQFGYAQYLGGVLNPFDMTQAQLAEEGIDKSKPYAQAYLEQGGSEKDLTKQDYRLLVDAMAYTCITNGMDWGTPYESAPIRSLEEFSAEAQEGDDMSVMMASSFCAYLADKYGFDKLTGFCCGNEDFKKSFGTSFSRAFERWQEAMGKQFS